MSKRFLACKCFIDEILSNSLTSNLKSASSESTVLEELPSESKGKKAFYVIDKEKEEKTVAFLIYVPLSRRHVSFIFKKLC